MVYKLITGVRNYLYDTHFFESVQFDTPTIVVGNLSVGGTGKTPQIEYLISLLQKKYKVAVLSRGYKRKSEGFVIADSFATAETIGDEPFQYYNKFNNLTVCVDADRVNAIEQLELLKNAPEVILLDDAFQHRKVKGGLNILLTTYNNLYVNDKMLPTGNLREQISGAKRAQIIIVTKCPENLLEEEQFKVVKSINPTIFQQVFFTTIEYDNELKGVNKINLQSLFSKEVLLVTGIANPVPLENYLTNNNIKFKHLKFPDHHNFSVNDITKIKEEQSKNRIVLTTEKDYVRIFEKVDNIYYITIKTKFLNHTNDFNNIINKYVEQSSRNC